jgi:hypothetical protein
MIRFCVFVVYVPRDRVSVARERRKRVEQVEERKEEEWEGVLAFMDLLCRYNTYF